MKMILPYASKHHLNHFYASKANESFSIWRAVMEQIWECNMNFNTMLSKLTPRTKAYRPTWGEGEFLWKKDKVLVHNTPYWGGEQVNQYIGGFPYVCEDVDVNANDWVLVAAEE